MPIVGTRYVPEVHTGTRDEIIRSLIAEAKDIAESDYMRLHAQRRELDRIQMELRKLNVDMIMNNNCGEISIIIEHIQKCKFYLTGQCDCPVIERFANPAWLDG